ncbi:7-carboxy-7-deazaguanine synthase [Magnetospirillum sp. J10]|uniref:7-carboxy-7-deazaguanine synthase n=2 Tax=Magnetospirillum sulfuroxidans TaxID=611300 RepID=A0ABS5ID83_9PROT|nr:7-carboxy-7-deazaguanine synthase [Magnetospirillum sulfuroxidans]MBR9972389.1 7-carboxy-7-deazaguanine synthase [Magnetospirillum sulfuroxidans]
MAYTVKELFYTLQGEGGQAGRAAIFLRFAGCNLWSGREADRATAQCRFCDTDFVGGDKFADADILAAAVAALWPKGGGGQPLVVVTGGEPGLQLDEALIHALHRWGLEIAVESNGTIALPDGIDWVCISPKAGTDLHITAGDEIKLVWPQAGIDPTSLERLPFRHYFLQPMDGPDRAAHMQACISFCLTHPRWRLSLQTHKILGIP